MVPGRDNGVPQGSVGRDCLGRRRVRRIGSTCGPIFGSCLVNSDGRSNGISPSLISPLPSFSTLSSLGRTTPRTIFPTPSSSLGLVRPLLLLLNPPFRSSEPIYSVFRHLSSRRVDFPFSPSVSIDISVPNSFVKEAKSLSPQSGCANTAYDSF